MQVRTVGIFKTKMLIMYFIACVFALHMQSIIVNVSIQLKICIYHDYTER